MIVKGSPSNSSFAPFRNSDVLITRRPFHDRPRLVLGGSVRFLLSAHVLHVPSPREGQAHSCPSQILKSDRWPLPRCTSAVETPLGDRCSISALLSQGFRHRQ